MNINFIKMHGCGNDFLIIDNRNQSVLLERNQIIQLADYKQSIGFDQLLLIENSDIADVAIKIFNNDGGKVSACGNGSRCVARLILEESNKESITIATDDRVLSAKYQEDLIAINMGKAEIAPRDIKFSGFIGTFVEIGNPHVVVNTDDLDNLDILKYGPLIENDPRFPNKVNVNFVEIINKDSIKLCTWERGVGSTLACGTGACASFYCLYSKNLVNNKAVIKQPGGEVIIAIENGNVLMAGAAEISYRGGFEQR